MKSEHEMEEAKIDNILKSFTKVRMLSGDETIRRNLVVFWIQLCGDIVNQAIWTCL